MTRLVRTISLVVLLALVCTAAAQISTGTPTPSIRRPPVDLYVRVVAENERPLSMSVRVQLQNNTGVTIQDRITNDLGQADFPRCDPGNYRITVSGIGVEATTGDTFSLRGGEGVYYETIRVKLDNSNRPGSPAPGGLVTAIDLNVPGKAEKEFEKGNELLRGSKLQEARDHFQKAVEFYPNYAAAHNNLGIVLMNLGDKDLAKAEFDRALNINSKYTKPYLNLARMAMSAGDRAKAEELLATAIKIEPTNAEALTMAAVVYLMNAKPMQTVDVARKVHSGPHEQYAYVHYAAGRAYLMMHQEMLAMNEFEMFLKESPKDAYAEQARAALRSLQKTN